jgi:hypothetical protein
MLTAINKEKNTITIFIVVKPKDILESRIQRHLKLFYISELNLKHLPLKCILKNKILDE